MKYKIVYVPLAVDILHSGHLNIIKKAKKFGQVYIGLLSNNAISKYKKIPLLNFEERYKTLLDIKGISKIIKEEDWTYVDTIKRLKPNFFIHGDDWKINTLKKIRSNVIKNFKKNNLRQSLYE